MPAPWMTNPPTTLQEKVELLKRKKEFLKSPGSKGKFLRALLKEVNDTVKLAREQAQKLDPLMFFKPSYEQSLVLNAWIYGIQFTCIYSGNRIGKTTVEVVDKLLWIFPNNPKWKIFEPYTDHLGRKVQVFPRPDISAIKQIGHALDRRPINIKAPNPRLPHYHQQNQWVLQWLQKQVPSAFQEAYPNAPWNTGGTIWFGGPDHDHHEKILFPLWKQYIPANSLDRYSVSQKEITIKVTSPTGRITVWELAGKSYESEDTKWSSGAVDIIMLTEGVTPAILKEVKLRFKDPGIGSHDYTPYLPANSGAAAALASRIAKGTEPMPLRHFAFTEFSVYDAPVHIMTEDKRLGLIRSYENDPEGEARLKGKFYTSSGLVLSKLDKTFHLLPFSVMEMRQRFPTGKFLRGLDPGHDHPTACAWGYLLPTNQIIIYRMMSESGLTINERCEKIILKSGNKRIKKRWGSGPNDFFWKEVHPSPQSEPVAQTFTDYHVFKKDETTNRPYAVKYHLSGLRISQSTHMRPEDRAIHLNDALQISDTWMDIRTLQRPGPRIYFLEQGEGIERVFDKWLEFYWDRVKSGENKGMPNDKVPTHGDDELDATCYIECAPIVWTNQPTPVMLGDDLVTDEYLIQTGRDLLKAREHPNLQPLQKREREVVIFGGGPLDLES